MANDIRVTPSVDGPATTPTSRIGALDPPATAQPSLGELFKELAQESSTLIKQEIALAKTELSDSVGRATTNVTKLAIALGLTLTGGLVLTAFLVVLIGDLLDNYWASALIVGALFALIGGVMAMSAVKRLKNIHYAPETTLQTLKQDKVWAQSEVQQVKRDLTA